MVTLVRFLIKIILVLTSSQVVNVKCLLYIYIFCPLVIIIFLQCHGKFVFYSLCQGMVSQLLA